MKSGNHNLNLTYWLGMCLARVLSPGTFDECYLNTSVMLEVIFFYILQTTVHHFPFSFYMVIMWLYLYIHVNVNSCWLSWLAFIIRIRKWFLSTCTKHTRKKRNICERNTISAQYPCCCVMHENMLPYFSFTAILFMVDEYYCTHAVYSMDVQLRPGTHNAVG